MATLSLTAQTIPLREDQGGVIRVGQTRVRLDTVVYAFNQGFTAEEIILQYPSLDLADVYGVIAYYLNNRQAVDAYIEERNKKRTEVQQEAESRSQYQQFREQLLKRRNNLIEDQG